MATLLIVPTFNEAYNIVAFVSAVRRTLPDADLLIVDDGSPDGTGRLAAQLAATDTRVRVLHRDAKRGLGAAYVAGFSWGLERGYRRFVEMDADFSHDPGDLPRLLAALEAGADVAVGSRNVPGGAIVGWGILRHAISKGGSLYSRTLLRSHVRDMTTGFKAYTRAALERLDIKSVRSNGYAFQVETTHRALVAGLKVVEVPITFVDRRVGQSKMRSADIWEAITRVLTLCWTGRSERRR